MIESAEILEIDPIKSGQAFICCKPEVTIFLFCDRINGI
jgi:hypothetical protein